MKPNPIPTPQDEHRDLSDDLPPTPTLRERKNESTLLFSAAAGVFLAAYLIDSGIPPQAPHNPWPLLAFGLGFTMLASFWAREGRFAARLQALLERSCRGLHIDRIQALYMLFALASAAIAAHAAGSNPLMRHAPLAAFAWGLSIVLAILGCWPAGERPRLPSRSAVLLFVLFSSLAFLLRAFETASIPGVLTGDEGSVGLSAMDFLYGRFNNLFSVGWFDFPSLFFYLQSLSISLLGQTIEALRLPSTFIGALTVGMVYLAGRRLFDRSTGILAALFLSGFHFHIHFSRLGLNNIWDGLLFTISLGALWYGWHKERRSAFLLAGAAAGFAQFFYVTARLLLLIVPLWLLLVSLLDRPRFRRNIPHLLPMFLAGLVVFFPLLVFYAGHPYQYLAPITRVNIVGDWASRYAAVTGGTSASVVWDNLLTGLQAFTSTPVLMFYTPGVPILRPLSAGLFVLGLALIIWRWRDSRSLLILLWLLAITLTAGLSTPVPAAQRYVAAAPALALLVAHALRQIASWLERLSSKLRLPALVLSFALAATLAGDDLRFYYLEFTPFGQFSDLNTWRANALADELQTRDGRWQVVFFGMPTMAYHSIASLPYLAPHIHAYTPLQPWDQPPQPQFAAESRLLFIFLAEQYGNLQLVESDYPGGSLKEVYNHDGVFLYWMYTYDGTQP